MITQCQTCGKDIKYFPSNPRKFCSKKCYGISVLRQLDRICQQCGQPFTAMNKDCLRGGVVNIAVDSVPPEPVTLRCVESANSVSPSLLLNQVNSQLERVGFVQKNVITVQNLLAQ